MGEGVLQATVGEGEGEESRPVHKQAPYVYSIQDYQGGC